MNRDNRLVTASTAAQQLHSLPIPAGALVIDIRDMDDDVLAILEGEIKDLANEMNLQQVDHWRYLTTFIKFLPLPPLSLDEVKILREEEEKQRQLHSAKRRTRSAPGQSHTTSYKPVLVLIMRMKILSHLSWIGFLTVNLNALLQTV